MVCTYVIMDLVGLLYGLQIIIIITCLQQQWYLKQEHTQSLVNFDCIKAIFTTMIGFVTGHLSVYVQY